MATITTTSQPDPQRSPWARAPGLVSGSSPPGNQGVGKIIFSDDFAVAAKITTNESLVIMDAVLPAGFFYRIQQLWVTGQGDDQGRFVTASGFGPAIRLQATENGVITYQAALYSDVEWKSASTVGAVAIQPASVTNNFQTWFLPEVGSPIQQFLIDASQGTSEVIMDWVDISTDATTAIQVQWRLELIQFTIEQGISAGPNSPILTFAG